MHVSRAVSLCQLQESLGGTWALEHPQGSSAWQHSIMAQLLSRPTTRTVDFDMCAFDTEWDESDEKQEPEVLFGSQEQYDYDPLFHQRDAWAQDADSAKVPTTPSG